MLTLFLCIVGYKYQQYIMEISEIRRAFQKHFQGIVL